MNIHFFKFFKKINKMVCPRCGKEQIVLRLKKNETQRCKKCGAKL